MKKKALSLIFIFVLLVTCFAGCNQTQGENEITLYYLKYNEMGLCTETRGLNAETTTEQIQEVISLLGQNPKTQDAKVVIEEDVVIQKINYANNKVVIDFGESYLNEESTTKEVLIRSAIVRSLLQIEEVKSVEFTIDGQALRDARNIVVGEMTANTFVQDNQDAGENDVVIDLTLYYSNYNGEQLVAEQRTVHYNSNTPLEKVVLEQLIYGPQRNNALSVLSEDTTIISVTVQDEICYVNFDNSIQSQNNMVKEEVALYSIVNSLTELPSISKVQILVNGQTKGMFRYSLPLNQYYSREESLIQQ